MAKINIEIKELESLVRQQVGLCIQAFEDGFRSSDYLKDLTKIDLEEKMKNRMHEIRDNIYQAKEPNDLTVLKKYLK